MPFAQAVVLLHELVRTRWRCAMTEARHISTQQLKAAPVVKLRCAAKIESASHFRVGRTFPSLIEKARGALAPQRAAIDRGPAAQR